MCRRVGEREAFGKKLARFDTILQDIPYPNPNPSPYYLKVTAH